MWAFLALVDINMAVIWELKSKVGSRMLFIRLIEMIMNLRS